MKKQYETFQKKTYILLLSILPAIFWFIFVSIKTGIVFETNDDRYITEILSGTLTGSPQAHTTHVNFLLCLPLSWLYRITGRIAWYGWMLLLCQLFSYFLIGYLMLKKFGLKSFPFYLGIMLSGFYITGLLQYTSTTSLIAVTGYLCFLLLPNRKLRNWSFFLFEFMAFLIRRQAMLIVQPFCLLTLLGLVLIQPTFFCKKEETLQHRCFSPVALLVLAITLGLLGNGMGYHSADWQTYLRFNAARTEMFDYYGVPDYASAKNILDAYEVSEAQYLSFCNFTVLEENLSAECLEKLADLAKKQHIAARGTTNLQHLGHCILNSMKSYGNGDYWGLGIIPLALWVLLLLGILFTRAFPYLLPTLGLWFGRTISWSYLLFRGRLLARVMIPMYLCETILLILLLFGLTELSHASVKRRAVTLFLAGSLFFLLSLHTGIRQYRFVKEQNAAQLLFVKSFPEMQEYCLSHPENRYLIEAQSLGYYRGSALSPLLYQPRNSLVTGCWYSPSPKMRECWETYLGASHKIDDNAGKQPLYFIVADGQGERISPILTYLSEYTGHTGTLYDQFTVSHGGTYLVYCYE